MRVGSMVAPARRQPPGSGAPPAPSISPTSRSFPGPITRSCGAHPSSARPTSAALADASRAFAADERQQVAVLTGAGGVFSAGADLKAIGGPRGNRVLPDGDGPLGPTRMRLGKPVVAAVEGHAVAGGLE